MADMDKIVGDLKQMRDELKLQIHLGSKEAQDQWNELEKQWDEFEAKAKLGESAQDVADAAGKLGSELADAYKKIKDAL